MNYSDIMKYVNSYIDKLEKFILDSSKLLLLLNEKIDRVLEQLGGEEGDTTASAGRDERIDEENNGGK